MVITTIKSVRIKSCLVSSLGIVSVTLMMLLLLAGGAAAATPQLNVSANPTSIPVGFPMGVTFTVTSNGTAVSNATVTLSDNVVLLGGGGVTYIVSGTTGNDGTILSNLEAFGAGTITATASETGYANGTTNITAASFPPQNWLNISASPTTIIVGTPTNVTLMVTCNSAACFGQPFPNATIVVTLSSTPIGSGTTNNNGTAVISVNTTTGGVIEATAIATGYVSATANITSEFPSNYTITGTVTDTTSGAAISGANVTITGYQTCCPPGTVTANGTTNATGGYNLSIPILPFTQYTVTASAPGFASDSAGITTGAGIFTFKQDFALITIARLQKIPVGLYDQFIGKWLLFNASAPDIADYVSFGFPNTLAVVGDWNGDNKTKVGVYNVAGNNFLLRNPDGTATVIGLGWAGVTPVVGDWNGDGKTKVGVYDGNGTWALENASAPGGVDIVGFGFPNTIPVVGDWNGDNKTKVGVYNVAGNNFVLRNSDGTPIIIGLGWAGVTPVVGDWNGDGTTKVGVYDSNNGIWALENASATGGADIIGFGFRNTVPVIGDWDGNGKAKVGVYNGFNIAWNNFVLRSSSGAPIIVGLGFPSGLAQPVVGKWS